MSASDINSYALNLERIGSIVTSSFYTIFGLLGIVLNILGIIGFSRQTFIQLSSKAICQQGFFNIAIAVVNIVCLVFIWLANIPSSINRFPNVWSTSYGCILVKYLEIVFRDMSSWLDMLLAVDRMICITFPRRFLFLKLKKVLAPIMLSVFGFILLIHLENFIGAPKIRVATTPSENASRIALSPMCSPTSLLSDVILVLMRLIVPLAVMSVSNLVLIYNLIKVKGKRYSKKEATFARSVIALNVLFYVTQLPFLLVYIIKASLLREGVSYEWAQVNLAYSLSLAIAALNCIFPTVVSFMLNKLFREELMAFFSAKKVMDSSTGINQKCPT